MRTMCASSCETMYACKFLSVRSRLRCSSLWVVSAAIVSNLVRCHFFCFFCGLASTTPLDVSAVHNQSRLFPSVAPANQEGAGVIFCAGSACADHERGWSPPPQQAAPLVHLVISRGWLQLLSTCDHHKCTYVEGWGESLRCARP
jgi:hypothetical protein